MVDALADSAGGAVRLVRLEKRFEGSHAVRGIDLDIHAGEFFSLLGPSGCGKTTTLRMIAGFEEPSAGEILLDGADLVAVPAHRRPVNTVFQSYALFPFLDVWDNVAFGLRYQKGRGKDRKEGKVTARRRVGEMLELVQMTDYARRRPGQLSGGQQQRVALARALVLQPRVLLLDEPLGALDAKLRKHLQLELKAIQQEVGVTFVYVTHDQEEALTMSDRLAVMRDGRVEQVGAPEAVYAAPESAYVAGFLGSANVLDVTVLGAGPGGSVDCGLGELGLRAVGPTTAGSGKVIVRPERIVLEPAEDAAPEPAGHNVFHGLVDRIVYLGPTTHVVVRLADGQTLLVAVPNTGEPLSSPFVVGRPVRATFPAEAARLLPGDEGLTADPTEALPDQRASAAAGTT
ncbi:MAG TPA: ABC transporter ATP-binding protein [Actinomycetes bacterium]|jgi:spermidine/putrescine transport system ATP-binding protein|nr:ABC transporter ATP-binding protein [Actinomycetes bacterium]